MPDNTKAIGNDPNLKSIAEMAVDVHLLNLRISGRKALSGKPLYRGHDFCRNYGLLRKLLIVL